MLDNYAVKMELELQITKEYTIFNNDAYIADYARDAIEHLFMAGIINGKPGDIFDPKGEATRTELATMLMRFLEAIELGATEEE